MLRLYKLICCLIFSCTISSSFSQVPASWRIGRFSGVTFSPTTTPFLYGDTIFYTNANSTMWDQNGKIIFFSNGIQVWDSSFNQLPNGNLFSTLPVSSQFYGSHIYNSSLIISRPGYPDQYLIFHENDSLTGNPQFQANVSLFYSIIDRSINNGMGDVTNTKNVFLEDSLWIGNIAAVKHGNGRDYWVIAGKYKTDLIYTWLVQPDTILGPFQQHRGISWTSGAIGIWQTNFSEDGERFAITYQDIIASQRRLLLQRFDRCSGLFYDSLLINITNNDTLWTYSGLYGCGFSPSSRYLYTGSATYLYQFDLQSSNIPASMIQVGVHDHATIPFSSGFNWQKLAPDGRIYIATGNGNYALGAIHFPDSSGISCQVELRYLNYYTQFGVSDNSITMLPNYPNYNLGSLSGSLCDTLVSINDPGHHDFSFNISPNPAELYTSISYVLPQGEKGTVEIFDITGKQAYWMHLPQWSTMQNVSTEYLAPGVYWCRIRSGGNQKFQKLVVVK